MAFSGANQQQNSMANRNFIVSLSCVIVLLIEGCSTPMKDACASSYMNHHKFIVLSGKAPASGYFVIEDTIHLEYSSKGLYAESAIKWISCSIYVLTVKKIYDENGIFQTGDTLSVKITSIHKDTLTCDASSHNRTFSIQFLRTSK
jgi:hypothetical protein